MTSQPRASEKSVYQPKLPPTSTTSPPGLAAAPRRLVPRAREHGLQHELLAHALHVGVVGVVRERERRVGVGGRALEHLAERRGPPVARLGAEQSAHSHGHTTPAQRWRCAARRRSRFCMHRSTSQLGGVSPHEGGLYMRAERRPVQRVAGSGVRWNARGHSRAGSPCATKFGEEIIHQPRAEDGREQASK